MNDNDLILIANHAHQLRELAGRVDLLALAKRIEGGERPAMVTSDEQAQQLVALLRATQRYADETAVPK